MLDIAGILVISGIAFGRNLFGIVVKPYETYRRIVDRGHVSELFYIAVLLAIYFAIASVVKTAAFRPFLLTKQFLVLASAVAATYLFVVGALWVVGKYVGGKGSIGSMGLAWGYTLIPTLLWFLSTSLLYVLLPPPRTTSTPGITLSILFLIFSATLFFWKLMLAYLTLRFGLRMDLVKIVITAFVVGPLLGIYSIGMYRLGIFRVPFL